MLCCHLPPGSHKLSRGSCWQGARRASVALMWVSAGHMPGPGQGVWLEAPGARLNYAGGEEIFRSRLCHSGMRNLHRCPRRHCSALRSRALYLWVSPAGMSLPCEKTAAALIFLMESTGWFGTHLPAAPGCRAQSTGRRMLWRGCRTRGGPASCTQPHRDRPTTAVPGCQCPGAEGVTEHGRCR